MPPPRLPLLPSLLLLQLRLLLLLQLRTAPWASAEAEFSKNRTISYAGGEQLLMWNVRLRPEAANCARRRCLDDAAEAVASAAGLRSWGRIPGFGNVYTLAYWREDWQQQQQQQPPLATVLRLHGGVRSFAEVKELAEASFQALPVVSWFSQEVVRRRHHRAVYDTYNDPFLHSQWHLKSESPGNFDLNVTGVWDEGFFGEGVTVSLLDDGMEYTNPDLLDAYNPKGSYDFNENDYDPMPTTRSTTNHHGTRCAGEIAAKANNNFCGVGVAPGATVSALKLLDGAVIDSMEGMAYNYQYHGNYIYTSSWGPPDTGDFLDGPHLLGRQALRNGVRSGRHGFGSIYVVASGNGGFFGDNCNYDGYASSEFTVTVGAVTRNGGMPAYAEQCACIHAVTVSSGAGAGIVTTDWQRMGGTGCTANHGGTSAAAPLAAGVIALALSVRPCLTWRDVQHIVVLTAERVDKQIGHYSRNGAGLMHSHQHGFGMLSAWRIVQLAKIWSSVPPVQHHSSGNMMEFAELPGGRAVQFACNSARLRPQPEAMVAEHVKVFVSVRHPRRGRLSISLRSPSGTLSLVAAPRPRDTSSSGLQWTFSTVRCWGESPSGEWQLIINNTDSRPGLLRAWRLIVTGSSISWAAYQARIREVRDIVTGKVAVSKAKDCPRTTPTFTAEGRPPVAPFNSEPAMQVLRKIPLLMHALVAVSACALAYYAALGLAAWCRQKYKQRAEARDRRSRSAYDYEGEHPRRDAGAEATPLSAEAPDDLPPTYEEAISETTSLLARYDAHSSRVTFPFGCVQ